MLLQKYWISGWIFFNHLCWRFREISQVSNFSPKMYFQEYLSIVEGSHISHVNIQIKLDCDSVCSTDSGQQDVTQPSQTAISVPAFHSPQSSVNNVQLVSSLFTNLNIPACVSLLTSRSRT